MWEVAGNYLLSVLFLLFGWFINREWVASAVSSDPAAFLLYTALAVLGGFFLGLAVGGGRLALERVTREQDRMDEEARSARERDRQERELAERRESEESERVRQRETCAREWALDLSPFEKEIIAYLRDNERLVSDWVSDLEFSETFSGVDRALEATRVDSNSYDQSRWRLSLNDFGRLVAEVASDVLDEVKEYGHGD